MFIPMYKKGRALNFGKKYPGIKIETVIQKDPEYVVWCLEHVDHFDLDNELYGLLENELRAHEHRRNQEYWTQLRSRMNESREYRNTGSDVSIPVTITFNNDNVLTYSVHEMPEITNPEPTQRAQDILNREYLNEWRITDWREDE